MAAQSHAVRSSGIGARSVRLTHVVGAHQPAACASWAVDLQGWVCKLASGTARCGPARL